MRNFMPCVDSASSLVGLVWARCSCQSYFTECVAVESAYTQGNDEGTDSYPLDSTCSACVSSGSVCKLRVIYPPTYVFWAPNGSGPIYMY